MAYELIPGVGPCPQCQSQLYQKTHEGFLICIHGHQSQNYWEEQQDDFEPGTGGGSRRIPIRKTSQAPGHALSSRKTRAFDADLQQIMEEEQKIIRTGQTDRFLYLEALQVILQSQIDSLIALDSFWNCLYPNVTDHPLIESIKTSFKLLAKKIWFAYVSTLRLTFNQREVNVIPTETDAFAAPQDQSDEQSVHVLRFAHCGGQLFEEIKLPILLLILYLSLVFSGVPVFLSDIYYLVLNKQLPYLFVLHLLPKRIARRLNHLQKRSFQPRDFPTTIDLYENLSRFLHVIERVSQIPDMMINLDAMVRRLMKEFGVPIGYYNWIFNRSKSMLAEQFQTYGIVLWMPCCVISACIIFFLKQVYGLVDEHLTSSWRSDCLHELTLFGLPSQSDFSEYWSRRIKVFFDPLDKSAIIDQDITDDNYEQCLAFALRFLNEGPAQDDPLVSNIFRSFHQPPNPDSTLFTPFPPESFYPLWNSFILPRRILLPIENICRYRHYSDKVDFDQVDRVYLLVLDLGSKLTGVPSSHLHKIIQYMEEISISG